METPWRSSGKLSFDSDGVGFGRLCFVLGLFAALGLLLSAHFCFLVSFNGDYYL
jgi:hypothetical protein